MINEIISLVNVKARVRVGVKVRARLSFEMNDQLDVFPSHENF